jgi:Domain of unknown function (DUF4167)
MRPGQNNKRMRGRPTNNRRGPNPLTRSYESNGPDVKIRGNAHHVAEKYLQLARDAHTSGDPVAAENYLQHAEHYFRLIAAAQAAQLQAQQGGRPPGEAEIDEDDDDGDVLSDRFSSPSERAPAPAPYNPQPQPPQYAPPPNIGGQPPQAAYQERQPFENDRQNQGDRNNYQPRQDRQQQNRHQQDRGPRQDRPFQDRQDGQRDNRNPRDNRPREFRPYRDPNAMRDPQPVIEPTTPAALPSFITAAPRVVGQEGQDAPQPVIADIGVDASEPSESPAPYNEGESRFPGRGRRRRLRSPYGFHAEANAEEAAPPAAPDDAPVSE